MGLSTYMHKLLLEEQKRTSFSGKCLTLGVQVSHIDAKDVEKSYKDMEMPFPGTEALSLSKHPYRKSHGLIDEECLYKLLGFNEVKALDYSDYEDAEIIFDLNEAELPKELENQFDAIFDFGTLEHVFNIANALTNLHKMLKEGGRIIHASPFSNFPDHGFYCFNPTFFHDYYTTNKYEISDLRLFKLGFDLNEDWEMFDYWPGSLDSLNSATGHGLDNNRYGVLCTVTKLPESTGGVTPQQGVYNEGLWLEGIGEGTGDGIADNIRITLSNKRPNILEAVYAPDCKIAIYGAGSHTERLIPLWNEIMHKEISTIIVSEKEAGKEEMAGIPIKNIYEVENENYDLIIISSLSHQDDMVKVCKSKFDETPLLTFWEYQAMPPKGAKSLARHLEKARGD